MYSALQIDGVFTTLCLKKYIFQVHLAICNNITLKLLENVPSDEHYSLKIVRTFLKFQSGNNSLLHVSSSMGSLDTFNESDTLDPSGQKSFYKTSRPSILLPILGCAFLLIIYITCGAAFVSDTQNIDFRYLLPYKLFTVD